VADPRHKRDARSRPQLRASIAAASLAVTATGAAVASGISASPRELAPVAGAADPAPWPSATSRPSVTPLGERRPVVSRAETRMPPGPARSEPSPAAVATRRLVRRADVQKWTTAPLNIWTRPGEKARKTGLIDALTRVTVTGRTMRGRDELVIDGRSRWVTGGYLAGRKPRPEPDAGDAADGPAAGASCSNGTSVPSGVSSNIVAVHEAVCAAFPEITTYGTLRSDGEHAQGIAVDIMVSGARGWQVAEFVRDNSAALGVSYAIHARNIWSVQRAGEGWRGMEDRGSVTANHYDHVHVTTY
jgi:hypothetical protein